MKKKTITIMVALALIASMVFTGCGKQDVVTETSETSAISEAEEELSIDEAESDSVELKWTADDITLLGDIVSGIGDFEVSITSNELQAASYDGTIILDVTLDNSAVDSTTAGTYDAVYVITADRNALIKYISENGIELDDDLLAGLNAYAGDTVTITVPVKVTVVEDTSDAEETDVTNESAEQADVTETAETASSNTSSGNSGSSSSGNSNSSGNSSSSSSSKNNSSSSSSSKSSSSSSNSSKSTHTHSYSSKVTTAATCGSTGVMTYTCSCGSSYTETIPATGNHVWVAITEEQDVYETREVTRCSTCNVDMTNWSEDEVFDHLTVHILAKENTGGYYSRGESVKVGTETVVIGYKCSVCGATK